jgi:hypothetical protein
MTNDNASPRVKIKRRLEFARAFKDYPILLKGFASSVGLGYPGERTQEREEAAARQLASPFFAGRVMRFVVAQFAVQVIRTRATMEPSSPDYGLNDFARLEMVPGLIKHIEELDGFSVQASPAAEKAIRAVHESMAAAIFDALAVEAQVPDFDEADFWPDVFRGLADADPAGILVRGLSPVILDRLDRLRHVFRALAGGHVLDLNSVH